MDPLDQLRIYNEAYSRGEPLISDAEYDIFVIDNNLNAASSGLGATGKIPLPVNVFGQTKLQTEREYDRFIKGVDHVVIAEKLDGVSALIDTRSVISHGYTKGDAAAATGQSLDWLLPHIDIPEEPGLYRGEIIVSKKNFPKVQAVKDIANPLVFIASYVNSKTRNMDLAQYVDIRYFEIVPESGVSLPVSEQYAELEELGLKTPRYEVMAPSIYTDLKNILDDMIDKSEYVIDGIVISRDEEYTRLPDADPKVSRAYKHIPQRLATVKSVSWQTSEQGLLKPVIHIEPIVHMGDTYVKLTGKNAKEIVKLGIGPGAIIYFGVNVVPVMYGVKKSVEPQLPDVEYKWASADLKLIDTSTDDTVAAKKLAKFFLALSVQNVGDTTAMKLVQHGIVTPLDFLNTSKSAISSITNITVAAAQAVAITALKNVTEVQLMDASRVFNTLGPKKLKSIVDSGVNLYDLYDDISNDMAVKPASIPGTTIWEILLENLEDYLDFRDSLDGYVPMYTAGTETRDNTSSSVKYIMTGKPPGMTKAVFKSKLPNGYAEVSTVPQADIVIGSVSESSTKITQAKKLGKTIKGYSEYLE